MEKKKRKRRKVSRRSSYGTVKRNNRMSPYNDDLDVDALIVTLNRTNDEKKESHFSTHFFFAMNQLIREITATKDTNLVAVCKKKKKNCIHRDRLRCEMYQHSSVCIKGMASVSAYKWQFPSEMPRKKAAKQRAPPEKLRVLLLNHRNGCHYPMEKIGLCLRKMLFFPFFFCPSSSFLT